jgi:4a-hydroxytetrahydrobiopterin dehydratase
MTESTLPVLSDAEVSERLARELPHWTHEGGWIRRRYRTSGWKATLMVVNTVGHLAEAAWHHPDLNVSYAFVVVKLCTHSSKGITARDFALARKIEEVVGWRPGREPGSDLEGTPEDDPRFRYIKHDDAPDAA